MLAKNKQNQHEKKKLHKSARYFIDGPSMTADIIIIAHNDRLRIVNHCAHICIIFLRNQQFWQHVCIYVWIAICIHVPDHKDLIDNWSREMESDYETSTALCIKLHE